MTATDADTPLALASSSCSFGAVGSTTRTPKTSRRSSWRVPAATEGAAVTWIGWPGIPFSAFTSCGASAAGATTATGRPWGSGWWNAPT